MTIPDKAVEAAAHVKASGYDSYPKPAQRSVVEEVLPILDAAAKLNEYAKTAYAEGADREARGYVVARGILTDRADTLESGTN